MSSGGGGGTSSYPDYEYNKRMADIAEQQQEMANKLYSFWESDYKPLEQAQISANMNLIPKQTGLASAQIESQMDTLNLSKPAKEKFYSEAVNGLDVEEEQNLARADVESSFATAESDMRRQASSMGINPASGKYMAGLNDLARKKAAAKVGAASLAKRQAEETNFARLSTAMGLQSA